MSCEIIQFSAAARPARKAIEKAAAGEVTVIGRLLSPRQQRREGKPDLRPPATETAKNSRIRSARGVAWRHANRVAYYWRARLDWSTALELAHQYGIADSDTFASADDRLELVDKWRAAVVKKLLTSAPDLAAVNWKRAQLKSSDFPYLPVKKERVERAIADDVDFLAAHPTRAKRGTS